MFLDITSIYKITIFFTRSKRSFSFSTTFYFSSSRCSLSSAATAFWFALKLFTEMSRKWSMKFAVIPKVLNFLLARATESKKNLRFTTIDRKRSQIVRKFSSISRFGFTTFCCNQLLQSTPFFRSKCCPCFYWPFTLRLWTHFWFSIRSHQTTPCASTFILNLALSIVQSPFLRWLGFTLQPVPPKSAKSLSFF